MKPVYSNGEVRWVTNLYSPSWVVKNLHSFGNFLQKHLVLKTPVLNTCYFSFSIADLEIVCKSI